MADGAEVECLTRHLRDLVREFGGQAAAVRVIADQSMRLGVVPAAPPVAARLGSVLAELNELAGWCCADSGLEDHARHYFQRAVMLAGKVRDAVQVSSTLRYAGAIEREYGHPNDALKRFQLGQYKLLEVPGDDPRTAVLTAWLAGESALALADMRHEQAPRGNPMGCGWPRTAKDGAASLRSLRARQRWLRSLIVELDARGSFDHRELAMLARRVAAVRS